MDELLRIIQAVYQDVIGQVTSLDDITNDKKKKKLFDTIMKQFDQLHDVIAQVVPQYIVDEYRQGYQEAGSLAEAAGMATMQANLTDFVHLQAVQNLAADTISDLQAAIRTAQRTGISDIDNILRDVQDRIAQGVMVGATRKQITKKVMDQFLQNGMTAFITRDNRRLPLDFYSMTVTRTKKRQAHTDAHVNRYLEMGAKFVQVSQHGATCHECAKREGLILSIDGDVQGVPSAAVAGLPPYHPNCRHTIRPIVSLEGRQIKPYKPNSDPRSMNQKAIYDNEQKIRRQANAEKKQYMRLVAAVGAEAPATIGAFRRMKRADSEPWQALQAKYREHVAMQKAVKAINPPIMQGADLSGLKGQQPKGKEPINDTILSADYMRFTADYDYSNKRLKVDVGGDTFTVSNASETDYLNVQHMAKAKSKDELDKLAFEVEDHGELNGAAREVYKELYSRYTYFNDIYKAAGYDVSLSRNRALELGKNLNADEDKLTEKEKKAIRYYTGSSYTEINGRLRGISSYQGSSYDYIDQYVHDLDTAYDKIRIDKDLLVMRGSGAVALGEYRNLLTTDPQQLVGKEIMDKGFVSTSINASSKFSGSCVFQIKVPKGSRGIYVNEWSQYKDIEFELLLPRNTRFIIQEVKRINSEYHFLLEVVQ